jgi:cytochrome c556
MIFQRHIILPLLCSGVLLGGASVVQAGDTDAAVEYRQGLMNVFAWNAKPMGAMAKGKQAFDAARFAALAKDLQRASQLDMLGAFPEASEGHPDSDAMPDIWLDWEGFESRLDTFRSEAAKLVKVAAGGDEQAMKAQFDNTFDSCRDCHRNFKD